MDVNDKNIDINNNNFIIVKKGDREFEGYVSPTTKVNDAPPNSYSEKTNFIDNTSTSRDVEKSEESGVKKYSVLDIFRHSIMRKILFIICYLW